MKAEISVTKTDTKSCFEWSISNSNINELKDSVSKSVLPMCKLQSLNGEVNVEITITENGAYYDHDEYWAVVNEDYSKIEVIE